MEHEEKPELRSGWKMPMWRVTTKPAGALPAPDSGATELEVLTVGALDITSAIRVVELRFPGNEIVLVERGGEILLP